MGLIIDHEGIHADDGWRCFDGDAAVIPAGSDCLIPLEEWCDRATVWTAHARRLGLWLATPREAALVARDLPRFALVAVAVDEDMPAASLRLARRLREQGFCGELRAVGGEADSERLLRHGFDTVVPHAGAYLSAGMRGAARASAR